MARNTAKTPAGGPRAGTLLAGRYALRTKLGEGGFSEVWEAEDTVGGGLVAVKLLLEDADRSATVSVRSELSVLRLHRMPGVVRLLDEGTAAGRPFIVMERLHGKPFPGKGRRRRWPLLAPTAIALVEALARLHAKGVIHQDLKPANVIVDDAGKPTILDFGIAFDPRLTDRLDRDQLFGTIPYMAPERLSGHAATPKSDLYSLGVLLFEALTGEVPHDAEDTEQLVQACRYDQAPSVRQRAPKAPPPIAGLVDLLLSKDPSKRPQSALEVLGVLRGHPEGSAPVRRSFALGGEAAVDAVVRAARAGRSVDVVGPRYTGRTRCVEAARAVLAREKVPFMALRPMPAPFATLAPIAGALEDLRSERLARVQEVVFERVAKALAGGLVVIVDDADRMDKLSSAVLDRARGAGAVIRVLEERETTQPPDDPSIVRLAPLREADLEPLFAGPERLLHLPSDAARSLWARTRGVQARVAEELEEWLRAGIVGSDGTHLVVARDLLDRLELRAPAMSPASPGASPGASPSGSALTRAQEDLLTCLSIAWPDGTLETLSAATNQPTWQVENQIDELVLRGAARLRQDGIVEPIVGTSPDHNWSAERRRLAHRAVASTLAPGSPRRFFHMAMGLGNHVTEPDIAALAEEATALAGKLAAGGDLKQATAILEEALIRVRRAGPVASGEAASIEERLLATLLDVALADGTKPVVGKVQYEIGRAVARTELVARLDDLVQAALAYVAGGDRAARLLDAMPPFAELDLERRRQGLRALAARRCAADIEDAVLEDVSRWAAERTDPTTQARFAFWVGWWHYRRDRFAEAADWHARAAVGDPWRLGRISARIACAAALLETFDLERAREHAEAALTEARRSGSPYIEARAEWVRRSVLYRSELDSGPDAELLQAIEHVHAHDLEAMVYFTEATFAHRARKNDEARALAEKAALLWKFVNDPWPYALARSLALLVGSAPIHRGEIDDLGDRAARCPVRGIGIQILGLLAQVRKETPAEWRAAVPALTKPLPEKHVTRRMDVLSVAEALTALGVPILGGQTTSTTTTSG